MRENKDQKNLLIWALFTQCLTVTAFTITERSKLLRGKSKSMGGVGARNFTPCKIG